MDSSTRCLSKDWLGKIKRHSLLSRFYRLRCCVGISWQRENSCLANMECLPRSISRCTKLNTHPSVIGDEEQKVIEQFVITMYDRSSEATDIDAVRLDMFARKQRL